VRLHFQSSGQGSPLVLLHGLFGALDNWHQACRNLAADYRVVTMDHRNHGRSPHDGAMDYPAMAEDLRETLSGLGIDRTHLLGHSMGGKTAMEFALRHPDRVERLVLVDIAPRQYPPYHRTILAALESLHLPAFTDRIQIDHELAAAIPDIALRRFLLKNLARDPDGGFHWKMNLPAIHRNYHRLGEALAEGREFRGPALFIRGGVSDYVQPGDSALIHRLFPHAQIREIPHAGHWLPTDAPEEFIRIVREFLSATLS
jgi:pimeloyl-ACP methyl ester carboxylesterase